MKKFTSIKKGTISYRRDKEFKTCAIKMFTEQGLSPKEVAAQLGICIDTLIYWLKNTGFQTNKTAIMHVNMNFMLKYVYFSNNLQKNMRSLIFYKPLWHLQFINIFLVSKISF